MGRTNNIATDKNSYFSKPVGITHMKIFTTLITLTITSLLILFGCDVTDDPPSEEEVNQLNVQLETTQESDEQGITFMFTYSLPLESEVLLMIEDAGENEMGRPVDTTQQPGNYAVSLDAHNYPDGEYQYELLAEPVDGSENLRSAGTFVIKR